jgi:LysM repeat protein
MSFLRYITLLVALTSSLALTSDAQTRPRKVPTSGDVPASPSPANPPEVNAVPAQAGDTIAKIARRLKIPIDYLLNLNSFEPEFILSEGELINLPSSGALSASANEHQAGFTNTSQKQTLRGNRRNKKAQKAKKTHRPPAQKTESGYYTNVDGARVRRPTFSNSAPAGASARCRDGSYSFSRNRRGTCSHHGGVARWL